MRLIDDLRFRFRLSFHEASAPRRVRVFHQGAILALSTALLSQPCLADPPGGASTSNVQTSADFGYGKQEWSINVGYGFGVGIQGSNDGNLKEIRFVAVAPRWGVGFTDPLADGSWYKGNLDLLIEGAALFEYHPQHGLAGGGTLLLRYNFLQAGRIVPFIDGGAGIVGTDLDLKGQSDGFNFSVQGGLGFHVFVLPHVAVTAEARFHHISNASLRQPNSGINDCLFLTGASFFVK